MTNSSGQSDASAVGIAAGTWRVDPATSKIRFHTRKLGLIPVNGRFEEFGGEVRVDDEGVGRGKVTIETASIATGIKKRDEHLRSKDFFYADEYPESTFVCDSIKFGTSPRVTGTLRIRDKSIPIDTPVTIDGADDAWRLVADFEVDHDAAGLGWTKPGVIRKKMAAHVELTLVPAD